MIEYKQVSRQYKMKDEVLPQIPQQNIAQTQSMYDQLRKTSQKWFSGSHRRIFTNSNISHKQFERENGQLSERIMDSKISEWEIPDSNSQKMKLITMMRQQIEIGCESYISKIKGVLQDQAKKIKLLGDLLVKNQMELNKKNRIIDELVEMIEQNSNNSQRETQNILIQRIDESDQYMLNIFAKIQQLQNSQDAMGLKIKRIQKLYRQKLANISSNYAKKLKQISEQFQQRIDKVQKIVAMNQTQSKNNRKPSISQISTNNNISKSLQMMENQLQDLKIQIQSFKKKKYRYENYKFEEVQNQINNIYLSLQEYQQEIRKRTSPSPNLKASKTTHMTRTQSNSHMNNSQTSKTRFLNKYKSLINTRQQNKYNLRKNCSSQSQSESQVQQTFIHEQTNIQRLKRIIYEMKIKTPVRLEIDQTGYAKSTDTGMYLVDSLGDGFQFTTPQIQYLTANRIIIT